MFFLMTVILQSSVLLNLCLKFNSNVWIPAMWDFSGAKSSVKEQRILKPLILRNLDLLLKKKNSPTYFAINYQAFFIQMDWLRDFTSQKLNKFVILIPVTSRGINWGVVIWAFCFQIFFLLLLISNIGHFSSKRRIPAFLKTS